MMRDIVIDTNSIRLYGSCKDKDFQTFFLWLKDRGILTVSPYLAKEYSGVGSHEIAGLILWLINENRLNRVSKTAIDGFNDRRYRYRCNRKDHNHIKLVMLSFRKIALSQDDNFIYDVNNFPRYRATAAKRPSELPYN